MIMSSKKDTKGQLIVKDGNFAIYKTKKPILGGNYSVIDFSKKQAKNALCLDAAYELFRELTLKQTLIDNKMIEP